MMKEPKPIGHEVKFKNNLYGLWKKAWWEIPEIMGSSFMALVGFGLAGIGLYNYWKDNGDCREYKKVYCIVRDGDPRAATIKNPVYTKFGPSKKQEKSDQEAVEAKTSKPPPC